MLSTAEHILITKCAAKGTRGKTINGDWLGHGCVPVTCCTCFLGCPDIHCWVQSPGNVSSRAFGWRWGWVLLCCFISVQLLTGWCWTIGCFTFLPVWQRWHTISWCMFWRRDSKMCCGDERITAVTVVWDYCFHFAVPCAGFSDPASMLFFFRAKCSSSQLWMVVLLQLQWVNLTEGSYDMPGRQ